MPTPIPSSRLPVRVPPQIRQRAEQAAQLRGLSLNSMIVFAVSKVADEIIQEEHLIRMTEMGTQHFWELMQQPPALNKALRKAVKAHKAIPRA